MVNYCRLFISLDDKHIIERRKIKASGHNKSILSYFDMINKINNNIGGCIMYNSA